MKIYENLRKSQKFITKFMKFIKFTKFIKLMQIYENSLKIKERNSQKFTKIVENRENSQKLLEIVKIM